MPKRQFLKLLLMPGVRAFRSLRMAAMMRPLKRANRCQHAPVMRQGGPVISLTTYGKRIDTVYLTIESIARGKSLPSRLILWLDDERLFYNLPGSLKRLQQRGLEVKLCRNYGPHTKYYPYLESADSFRLPLVIVDDDTLYSRSWLMRLVDSSRKSPEDINCHLAKVVTVDDRRIRPYMDWRFCTTDAPSLSNLAHGVAGVLFPPRYLKILKEAGTAFETVCPKADDLWLHVHAVRNGIKVKQIRMRHQKFPPIPGTQETGLYHANYAGGNDRQIAATYTAEDIRILAAEQVA